MSMARTRNERGEYTGRIPAGKALEVFEQRNDSARPITANDVTEALGWSRRTAHNKLEELVERGTLDTRKVGARGRVWWLPSEGVTESSPTVTEPSPDPTSVDTIPSSTTEVLETIRDEIAGRNEDKKRERAEAILTAYEFLQRENTATNREIQEHTSGIHPDGDPERQWVNYIRDGLVALPGIEKPPQGASRWGFIDPKGELAEKLRVSVEDAVRDVEVTGEGKTADRYRAMVQIAYDYLKRKKSAEKEDFKRVTPDYTGHYNDFGGVWSYFFREALRELPGVEAPTHGGRAWAYVEPNGELDRTLNIEQDDWVAEIETNAKGKRADRLRSLVQIAYNRLKKKGRAEKDDFEQALPEYTGHYTGFDGLWGYLLKDVLRQAPGIELSGHEDSGPTTYIYTSN
jgi:DNA-binding Lrp family transcriptional regulator